MPHLHRFYIPPETPAADQIDLPPDEAHHALRVARVQEGEPVALIDGAGRELRGPLVRTGKRNATVQIESEEHLEPPAPQLTLLQAWLQRDKTIEEIIRRGTEIGVDRFAFFKAAHSGRTPAIDPKWNRLAIESCKQSGRLWLPEFEVFDSLAHALYAAPEPRFMATADLPAEALHVPKGADTVSLIIGPEGDFSPEELHQAQEAHARALSLGPCTLRAELAALVASTLVLYEAGRLGPS